MQETPLLFRLVVMSVVIVEYLDWIEMQKANQAKQARVNERLVKKEGSLFLFCCSCVILLRDSIWDGEPWFGSERDAVSIIQTNTHGQGVSAEVCRVWLASEKESSQRETERKEGANKRVVYVWIRAR